MEKISWVLFINNRVGLHILEFLLAKKEKIRAVILNSESKASHQDEIKSISSRESIECFNFENLSPDLIQSISSSQNDQIIGFSAYFGHILKQEYIEPFKKRIFNLHPSYLPFNRGANTNVWSIINNTPAGATIHLLNDKIDQGEILFQMEIDIDATDTGKTLYTKLEDASIQLFADHFLDLKLQRYNLKLQSPERGTYHNKADMQSLAEIDLNKTYTAKALINILRAKTFPPHKSAYFKEGNKKIYIELKLTDENYYES